MGETHGVTEAKLDSLSVLLPFQNVIRKVYMEANDMKTIRTSTNEQKIPFQVLESIINKYASG